MFTAYPRFLLALVLGLGVAASSRQAFAQAVPNARIELAPRLPAGAYAYWHSGKVLQKDGELTLVDLIGSSHFSVAAPWLSVAPDGGLVLDGTQPEGIRFKEKQPVGNRFVMGVDVKVDAEGPEHQTIAYIWRFCELRYRRSRGELTFNVWQSMPEEPARELVTATTLKLPAGQWVRVRAVIDDTTARLEVADAKAESKLSGSWEFLPPSAVFFVGKGGANRAFRGRWDHLYLALSQ